MASVPSLSQYIASLTLTVSVRSAVLATWSIGVPPDASPMFNVSPG